MSDECNTYTTPLICAGPPSANTFNDVGLGKEVKVPVKHSKSSKISELRVFVQGELGNHPIITVHEIGLNHRTCFGNFVSHPKAEGLLKNCCFYHIDLPGQSNGDGAIAEFPSLDQLGDWIGTVARHFNLSYFYGIGVGVGANLLVRYIHRKSETDPQVRALLSISPMLGSAGWYEWGYAKIARAKISPGTKNMPSFAINQSLAAFFGPRTHSGDAGRVEALKAELKSSPRADNYAGFLRKWTARGDLVAALKKQPITVPTLTFYGGNSLRVDHIVQIAGPGGVFKSPQSELVEVWKGADLVHEEDTATVLGSFTTMLRGFSVFV